MIRIVTCVTVICDRRNESAGAQDDDAIGELHFACLDEAAKHLPRWQLDPARGHAVCPGCGADEECATYGHDLVSTSGATVPAEAAAARTGPR